jgi:hypothetical protein
MPRNLPLPASRCGTSIWIDVLEVSVDEGQRGWPAGPAAGDVSGRRHWPAAVTPVEPLKPVRWWIWWAGGALALALLAGAAWSGIKLWGAFQASGKVEITKLHQKMKAQDWGGILAASDPAYQEQVGKAKSFELFEVVHAHMGDPVSYSVDNVNVATNSTEGTTETLVLETTFTKGEAVETLKYRMVGGVWRMMAYKCNSKLLDGVKLKTNAVKDGNRSGGEVGELDATR